MYIFVEHGSYVFGRDILTESGREQIQQLITKLRALVHRKKIIMISSPRLRATQSADLLADAFHVAYTTNELLKSSGAYDENLEASMQLLMDLKEQAEVIVLVTHIDWVAGIDDHKGIAQLFMEKLTGREDISTIIEWGSVTNGDAVIVDEQRGKLSHVQRKSEFNWLNLPDLKTVPRAEGVESTVIQVRYDIPVSNDQGGEVQVKIAGHEWEGVCSIDPDILGCRPEQARRDARLMMFYRFQPHCDVE